MDQTKPKVTWSKFCLPKFHGESSDNLFISNTVATQCFIQKLWRHISLEVWFIYSNVCCCNGCSCCWVNVNVNKSKKMVSLHAKIEYVIINSNWMQETIAGQYYSEETRRFSKYYIGWIGIGYCDQETSITICSGTYNTCTWDL